MQVFAVTLLTVGVVIAAWSDQQSKVGGMDNYYEARLTAS